MANPFSAAFNFQFGAGSSPGELAGTAAIIAAATGTLSGIGLLAGIAAIFASATGTLSGGLPPPAPFDPSPSRTITSRSSSRAVGSISASRTIRSNP